MVVLAQYHRAMEKTPVVGLKALAPEALGEKPGKTWLKRLKDAAQIEMGPGQGWCFGHIPDRGTTQGAAGWFYA